MRRARSNRPRWWLILLAAVPTAQWAYVFRLLVLGQAPPPWLIWPVLVNLAAELVSVPLFIGRGWPRAAVWRVLMALATVAALLWIVRSNP